MATLILHPTKDISSSGNASPNSGSTRYGVVGSNDGDSTYVNMRINNKDTVTNVFTVGFTGSFNANVKISSIRVGVIARSQSTSSKDTKNIRWNFIANGISGSRGSSSLASSYTSYGSTYNASTYNLTQVYTNINSLNMQVEVTIDGNQETSKTDAFDNYVTEVYIEITYSEVTAYTCNAVSGAGISNATASPTLVEAGYNCTFTATASQDYRFEGWYTAASGGTKVSGNNPYTTTINSNTTLYARGTAILYNAYIGAQPNYGSASVAPASGPYDSSVTFTCVVSDPTKMFWGWFTEPEHINCISTSQTYTTTYPRANLTLYPWIGEPLYTTIVRCSHVYDVKPFRWNGAGDYNNGNNGPSKSLVTNTEVLKTNSIGSETWATQSNPQYASDFNFAMAFHFTEGANQIPDNATIVGVEGHISLATTAGSQYYNMQLFAGEIEHLDYHNTTVSQPDETCISTTRGTARSLSVDAFPTDYQLNRIQMGTWTANEIKNGRCGIQLDFMHSGGETRLHIYDAELHVKYTHSQTTYTCQAVSDGHSNVYVMDANNPKYKLYDNDLQVTAGQSATWQARLAPGYRFDGWYSDSAMTQLVSNNISYTAIINTNQTLYAKTHLHSRVIAKQLSVPFGQGNTYYQAYYLNGSKLTSTSSGSNGYRADLDLTKIGLTGLSTQASIASTNGKEYIYTYLNSTAMNLLFPNSTAHPVSMNWTHAAGRGSATIVLNLVARNPMTPNETVSPIIDDTILAYERPSLIDGVESIQTDMRDDCVLNMTKSSNVGYLFHMTKASASKAIGVDSAIYTLYFEEYDFSAIAASKSRGIELASTNKTIGYEGDSVTFSVQLLPGVQWHGWYSDENCTNLVSTEQNYTCVPNANLTLYAYATTDLAIYNVSAIAGDFIKSATCNHAIMTQGNNVKFTAQLQDHCQFIGWYNNSNYSGEPLSTNLEYEIPIIQNTILYAKAEQIIYSISIEPPQAGSVITTATSGTYGTQCTLQWIDDERGWYNFDYWSSSEFILPDISEADYYSTEDISGGIWIGGYWDFPEAHNQYLDLDNTNVEHYAFQQGQLCTVLWDNEIYINVPVNACEYHHHKEHTVWTYNLVMGGQDYGYPFGIYVDSSFTAIPQLACNDLDPHSFAVFVNDQHVMSLLSRDNPYTHTITSNLIITPVLREKGWFQCSVVCENPNLVTISALEGHVIAGNTVTYQYDDTNKNYTFLGWYDDAIGTNLISADINYTFTPQAATTLYALVEMIATNIYIKKQAQYNQVLAIYKKENGTWVSMDADTAKLYIQNNNIIYLE